MEALIREKSGSQAWKISLMDNGFGNPDVVENDGVYSGSFIPLNNGAYQITVHVKNQISVNPSETRFERLSNLVRLIPINQTELDCEDLGNGCKTNNTIQRVLEIATDLEGSLTVVNRDEFKEVRKLANT